MTVNTGSTGIPPGSSLRIGYRPWGSLADFVYLGTQPAAEALPFTFTLPNTSSAWEVEYSTVCNSCGGGSYSDPVRLTVNAA